MCCFIIVIQAANSIAFCKKSMYYHRVHEGCVTSNALENGDMYFYHFKTVYDALLCGANPSFIKLLLNFVKRYSSNVKSKEKFCAIYAKLFHYLQPARLIVLLRLPW